MISVKCTKRLYYFSTTQGDRLPHGVHVASVILTKSFHQLPVTGKFLRVKKFPHVLVSSAMSGETFLN